MTIFLFQVSIASYPKGISDLPGCQHDGEAMLDFWQEYARINNVELRAHVLQNEEATRTQVLAGFDHFNQAGADDVCVFYFSGHGAQMEAPRELWHDEASKQCQTMVLYDSRQPGGQDLADKELSYLLATAAKEAGQLLVIADSCHSGTISRMASARPRTVAAAKGVRFEQLHGSEHYENKGAYYVPPHRDHITLSACQPRQVAVEMPVNGAPRGLFTYYLLETLSSSKTGELSYSELADRVRVRVKNHYKQQDIYVQATGQSSLDQLFLNGQLKRNRAYLLHRNEAGTWFFNQGSVQGIRAGAQVQCLVEGDVKDCTVQRVLAGRATVTTEDWMQHGVADYPIVAVELEEAALPVYITDKVGRVTRGNLLASVEDVRFPLTAVEDPQEAKYHLTMLEGYGLSLILPGEERPLFTPEASNTPGWEDRFLGRLAKVARYEATLALAPSERILPLPETVRVTLEQVIFDGDEVRAIPLPTDGSAVLEYQEEDGKWYPPDLRLRVTRRASHSGAVYAGGLLLGETFGISGAYLPVRELTATEPDLTVEHSGEAEDGSRFYDDFLTIAIDDKLLRWGVSEIENHFKVIVSETPFDLAGHEQQPLDTPDKIDLGKSRKVVRRSRGQRQDRWATQTVSFRVRMPMMLDESGRPIHGSETEGGITIAAAPEGLEWKDLCLHTSLSMSRSLHPAYAPPCPTVGFFLEPASSLQTRTVTAPKDVLEITKVARPEAVSPTTPLLLNAPKLAHEGCIALGYDEDSRRYYPIGFADPESGKMVIHQLPEPMTQQPEGMINQRSMLGSIKLFFRKVVNDYLPGELLKTNLLREVAIGEDFTVSYQEQPKEAMKKRVENCQKPIALFIHGIIGDTTVAPAILRRAQRENGSAILDHYGLVLTYDYENLYTELPKTARDFQEQLSNIGLHPGHDKTLHVFAHSMGGLVSRYFIERQRGHQVVNRLYQFGTPNGGSPFGTVAQLITPLLTWLFSAAAAYHELLRPLLILRWATPKLVVTLKQMQQGSDFLKDLKAEGDRRAVPYTLINGDIRLIPDIGKEEANLLARLFARIDWRDLVDLALFRGPTDVAVSVTSQRDIPGLANVHEPVGCDHLSYFSDPASIALFEQLWEE